MKTINRLLMLFAGMITAFVVLKMAIMVANVVSISVVANIPNEVRDFVQFRIIKAFMEGRNPYALSALENIPLICMYTFLQPLCVAIVCKFTGIGIIAGNFTVNLLCVLGTAICLWLIVKSSLSNIIRGGIIFCIILVASGTFFTMFSVPIFTFRPDAIGIFVSALLLLVMYTCPERYILSAFITVSLVHTKQILPVIALPIFIYYLLNDAKIAFKYFVACVVITISEIVILRIIFPIYWGSITYVLMKAMLSASIKMSINNIKTCCDRYMTFIIIGITGITFSLFHQKRRIFKKTIKHKYIVFLFLNIISSIMFLLVFARNGGDGLKYCQDMMAAPIVLFSILIWKHAMPSPSALKKNILSLALSIAALSLIMSGRFSYITFGMDDINTYARVWETIKQYDDGSPMFLGMIANHYLADIQTNEKPYIWYDDGQTEYMNQTLKKTENMKKLASLPPFIRKIISVPHDIFVHMMFVDKIFEAGRNYIAEVNSMIAEKKFKFVALTYDYIISDDLLNNNYHLLDSVSCLQSSGIRFKMNFYAPNDDN